MTEDERLDLMTRFAVGLMEHFTSVQIFAARPDDQGNTQHFNLGKGSWFERYGVVRAWILKEEATFAARGHKEVADDES